ncbi:prephenate dehydrogenase/arogenate dehydrogenase family protein [bacterium]|nr:prephenate dehydrogenase/arogenate dehydrogenase family protein [bacterium]
MKIGVIGLGLIGGSIFKALLNKYDVIGVSTSVKEKNVSKDYETLKECDLVFVCTPMNITLEILDKLENYLSNSTIVTDVCSLKGFVSKKTYSYKFIPSHPMAGTENSGWENSFPELFNGARWVITPIGGEIIDEQETLEKVIETMGAKTIITTPEEHDKAVALISHMPMVVAQALCENIKDNKLAQELASTGFKDTTRLALSNLQMANDMVEKNWVNITESLEGLKQVLEKLLSSEYADKAKEIKEFRQNLY